MPRARRAGPWFFLNRGMVGSAGFESATPAACRQRSTAELIAPLGVPGQVLVEFPRGRIKSMSRSLKIILFTVSGFIGLLVLAALALLFFVDANVYKPRLEAAASEALGMEVSIAGRLGIGLFPGLQLTLEDGRIRNRGTDLVSAKQTRLGLDLLPLLQKKVRIGTIVLERPAISIVRDRDGEFNFQKSEKPAMRYPSWTWRRFPFRTALSSTRINNREKDSRPATAIWTCAACGFRAGQDRIL